MQAPFELIGTSAAIRSVQQELDYAARSDAKVLVTGESGVGKEVVARLVHQRSHRSRAPLVMINCAGVPDTLLESELFGHVRGSFTDAYRDKRGRLELAHGGTVFLDEVGEMSLRMQALLLRFLECGELQRVGSDRAHTTVDVRVIAATNRELHQRIGEKAFREDLYYRLNVVHLTIPPLRQRPEDVLPLLEHFLRHYAEAHRSDVLQVTPEARAILAAYRWPGNVRELKNVAERMVVRARTGTAGVEDLPAEISAEATVPGTGARSADAPSAALVLYDRIVNRGESFWSAVYEPFTAHDLTRDDLRVVLRLGLEHTRGSYKQLTQLFNMAPDDYKRFLNFLRKHQCHMPFQRFRAIPPRPDRTATRTDAATRAANF
jgi:transcriptional regulator with GAF, ATPase, and Fis domain